MTYETPLSPRPLSHLSDVRCRVLTTRALREHGVLAADADARCRPGGPWQMLLPGVCLLYPGPPTSEDRLHAALLYTARRAAVPAQSRRAPAVPARGGSTPEGPAQATPGSRTPGAAPREGMITGLAALTLHGVPSAPPLPALDRIDVLLPRTRRLRSVGWVHIVRGHALPEPVEITGLPVAPVPRALADAVAQLCDSSAVRSLLVEAVRAGLSEPRPIVAELRDARLLTRPQVAEAVDALLAEGRALAEGRLYDLVRTQGLPAPCWNVDLRLPGGPRLGGVDAYWPDRAVALEIDSRSLPHPGGYDDELWTRYARKREVLERAGLTVVRVTPKKLREAPVQQAAVLRTALMAADDREPPAYVLVLPR